MLLGLLLNLYWINNLLNRVEEESTELNRQLQQITDIAENSYYQGCMEKNLKTDCRVKSITWKDELKRIIEGQQLENK